MMIIAISIFLITFILGQMGGISPFPGITVYAYDLGLALLLVTGWFAQKKKALRPTLAVPIWTFFAVGTLSLLVNAHRFTSAEVTVSALYGVRWILYAALYAVVVRTTVPVAKWLSSLYGAGLSVALLGLVQYMWYPYLRNLEYLGWDPHLGRVFSTLLDPNFAGMLLVCVFWLGFYIWEKARYKWMIVASQLFVLAALLLTYSRSAYIALALGILVWAALSQKIRLAIGVIILFAGVLFLLPRGEGEGVKLLRTSTIFARLGNWQRGAELIASKPVLGHGFNTLRYVQRQKGWVDDTKMVSHAGAGLDNSFQFIWATTGILGLISFFWIIVEIGRQTHTLWQNKKARTLVKVISATLIGLAADSLFTNSLFFPQIMIWMWILVGVGERVSSDR
jgi:hypothetical protein